MPFCWKQPVIFKFLHYCMKCQVFFDYLQFSLISIHLFLVFSRRSYFWHIVLICLKWSQCIRFIWIHTQNIWNMMQKFCINFEIFCTWLEIFCNSFEIFCISFEIFCTFIQMKEKVKNMQINCIVYSISIVLM